jgi:hypothetical protein
VLGVEIHPDAVAVQSHPFTGNTAFMLGNEVSVVGLTWRAGVSGDAQASKQAATCWHTQCRQALAV